MSSPSNSCTSGCSYLSGVREWSATGLGLCPIFLEMQWQSFPGWLFSCFFRYVSTKRLFEYSKSHKNLSLFEGAEKWTWDVPRPLHCGLVNDSPMSSTLESKWGPGVAASWPQSFLFPFFWMPVFKQKKAIHAEESLKPGWMLDRTWIWMVYLKLGRERKIRKQSLPRKSWEVSNSSSPQSKFLTKQTWGLHFIPQKSSVFQLQLAGSSAVVHVIQHLRRNLENPLAAEMVGQFICWCMLSSNFTVCWVISNYRMPYRIVMNCYGFVQNYCI